MPRGAPPRGGIVAVTGSAGFVGSWIVKALLDRGYRVRACVRNCDDSKVDFLKALPGHATKRLTVHSADLQREGAFDAIFVGCHAVIHAAADPDMPLRTRAEAYPQTLRNLLNSVDKVGTVSRVVLTSSAAAIYGEVDLEELRRRPRISEERYPNLGDPASMNLDMAGYSIGKVKSEEVVFEAAAKAGSSWDAIVVNPSDNLGPILAPHHAEARDVWVPWQCTIAQIVEGKEFRQNYNLQPWWIVDVRDTAEIHVRLLESDDTCGGKRYFACSGAAIEVERLGPFIAGLLPEARLNVSLQPSIGLSDMPADETASLREMWASCVLNNTRVRETLGLNFRTLEETVRDCVESLIVVAGITPSVLQE